MSFAIKTDGQTGKPYLSIREQGQDVLLHPLTNKGTGFTPEERDLLGLHGFLPPNVFTVQQQLDRTYESFLSKPTNLEKFIYLSSLQDRNEVLFFRLLLEHIEEMLPIIYTPTVGEACQKFSHIYRRSRGFYIGYDQRSRMESILRAFPGGPPLVIVVTDGERILGLGDQGAGGMGIPVGKLCLYTLCGGIPPWRTLPVMLDAGTDNPERLADPLYLGLRQKRVRGEAYQEFVDSFVAAVMKVFPNTLLQWEDFLKGNAMHQLARFRDRLCTFNDDIQGTASVVVAGIYGGLRITGQSMRDQRVLLAGAGAAAQGIAELTVSAFREAGLSEAEARSRIWMFDSKGLVTRDRPNLEDFKATFARDPQELNSWRVADRSLIRLEEVVANARPTVMLGTSGSRGAFTEAAVRAMAAVNDRPMTFPLSNPTSKSECTAEEAITWSDGRAIVATGSPFAPVEFRGKRYRIGQGNNAFIFPGVGLGVTACGLRRVTDTMFLDAARALAEQVTEADLAESAVYPSFKRVRECSHAVACAVVRRGVREGLAEASVLDGLEARISSAMWTPEYLPFRYEPVS